MFLFAFKMYLQKILNPSNVDFVAHDDVIIFNLKIIILYNAYFSTYDNTDSNFSRCSIKYKTMSLKRLNSPWRTTGQ